MSPEHSPSLCRLPVLAGHPGHPWARAGLDAGRGEADITAALAREAQHRAPGWLGLPFRAHQLHVPCTTHCWGREGMRCVGAKIACPPGTVLGNHCVHACNSTSLWPVTRDNPRVSFLLSQHMSSFSAGRWGSWEAPAQMKQLSCWISPPAADENHCFLPQPPLASPCPAPCAC